MLTSRASPAASRRARALDTAPWERPRALPTWVGPRSSPGRAARYSRTRVAERPPPQPLASGRRLGRLGCGSLGRGCGVAASRVGGTDQRSGHPGPVHPASRLAPDRPGRFEGGEVLGRGGLAHPEDVGQLGRGRPPAGGEGSRSCRSRSAGWRAMVAPFWSSSLRSRRSYLRLADRPQGQRRPLFPGLERRIRRASIGGDCPKGRAEPLVL